MLYLLNVKTLPNSQIKILLMQENVTPTDCGSQAPVCLDTADYSRPKNFSKEAVEILTTWLFENSEFPYPDCEEAKELCRETNLTLKQLRIWFINNRKVLRDLPPHP